MAAYTGESLNDIAKAKRIARKGLKAARDAETFAVWNREMDRLMERERILLRIPLPQAAKSPEPRRVGSSSVSYTEIPRSAPHVMSEEPSTAQGHVHIPASPAAPAAASREVAARNSVLDTPRSHPSHCAFP